MSRRRLQLLRHRLSVHAGWQWLQARRRKRLHDLRGRLLQRVAGRQRLTGLQLDLRRQLRRRLAGRRTRQQLWWRRLLHGLNQLHLLTRLNLYMNLLRWRQTSLK